CLLDQNPKADAFLFEGALGRYSYVGVGAERLTLSAAAKPLETLRAALEAESCERREDLPPFCGGYVGYLGWPASAWTERLAQRLALLERRAARAGAGRRRRTAIQGRRAARAGVHPRRRHLPGRPQPALRAARLRRVFALPHAAGGQPGAVSFLSAAGRP